MPMVCYLDRAQKLPMVPISVCLSADLAESFVRGPEKGPQLEDEELDHRLAKMFAAGESSVHAYGPSSGSGNYVISLLAHGAQA